MAKRNRDRARADEQSPQPRKKQRQDSPEQNRGYDEAVRGGPDMPPDTRRDWVATPPDMLPPDAIADVDEREAQKAAEDVRRRDQSASRRPSREP